MIRFLLRCKQIYDKYTKDEMTVYAAQASYFTIIAAFPFMMLLLAMIQFIPSITKANLLQLLVTVIPSTLEIDSVIVNVIEDLYTKSPAAILSVTAIAAIWSASKGMLSIERGLNRVFGQEKKRGYFMTRVVCAGYTVVFIIICTLTLVLLVLGSSIQAFMNRHFPILAEITQHVISFRTMLLFILTLCFAMLYTYVPEKKQHFTRQLPGAVFSTLGWIAFSFAFSIYFSNFSNYSVMYGSLTAIVLIMLWLYSCICILFFGAEINYYYSENRKE
ncbi:YihY/virulence factor BrkB family protein [Clostridium boliviensis]|uniref:YihY/virulence factor BrkB family protein n=1 Tax=Clostridium boliviensis TaxID=318465 RepID=A0ABU4GMR4_9CLOT|nr:YihY/virulence factor BrkB family protein [Clostridium boliviensis]MDW2798911.1 YihY/virulence factor BrkB family protein [Clostridium boliviensis]